jgi:very-short-patch-repair endonuclease
MDGMPKTSDIVKSILLRDSMSKFESKIWKTIGGEKNMWGFVPQWPLSGYIIDFYSETYRVALECDGPHHVMSDERRRHDTKREARLLELGVPTLHITPAMLVTGSSADLIDYIQNFLASLPNIDD